jgi:fatty-acyl-CoA synthase
VGEIVHRSPHLMLGYFNDPERTAAAFSGGWFHSGDLATIDDEGYITVVDRKKDMIKTGGENVASREVEEALYRLDGVSEVAVVGLPHPRWIEAVTAVIVVKPGHDLTEAQVLAHCEQQLAHFKAPKRVVFVDALPKNPSGKLLKRELRRRHRFGRYQHGARTAGWCGGGERAEPDHPGGGRRHRRSCRQPLHGDRSHRDERLDPRAPTH